MLPLEILCTVMAVILMSDWEGRERGSVLFEPVKLVSKPRFKFPASFATSLCNLKSVGFFQSFLCVFHQLSEITCGKKEKPQNIF